MGLFKMAFEETRVKSWVGVDWDGTLFVHEEWKGVEHSGEPIKTMVDTVKQMLAEGVTVKIFTARVASDDPEEVAAAKKHIEQKCIEVFGQVLEITNEKDKGMLMLYDDRAIQVEKNTGKIV